MSTTEILTKANSLPVIANVIANNMLTAQGYTPTAAERAAILARADFFDSVGMARKVNVKVIDFGGTHIGDLEFHV